MTPRKRYCSVGKTSILNRFAHSQFSHQYKATIGADFLEKEIAVDGEVVVLQIWDTAGQERFQSLGTSFYRGADGCVLVYDITNSNSLETVPQWREEFVSQAGVREPGKFPVVVVGNKKDLDGQRKVREGVAMQWCREHGDLPNFEVSAKDGTNVEAAFLCVSRLALSRLSKNQDFSPPIDLRSGKKKPARKCCGGS